MRIKINNYYYNIYMILFNSSNYIHNDNYNKYKLTEAKIISIMYQLIQKN